MKTKIYQSDVNNYYNEVYIENSLININNTIDNFNKLINNDNMTFDEYIDTLNKIYNIKLSNNDLLQISSYILRNTAKCIILNTDIVQDITRRIENKNNFEYIEEPHSIYIKIAFIDNYIINNNHKYSINEILELINNNKIVLLELILDEDSDELCNNEVDLNGIYPLIDITNKFNNLKYIRNEYIPYIIIYLKEYFSVNKLKQDLNKYLIDTKEKLEYIESYLKNIQDTYYTKIKKYDSIINNCYKIIKGYK